jgi:glutaredoxin
VLYAIPDCAPCDRGRQLLRSRGVPYQERLASSDADRDAWLRVVGSAEAPAITVGSQVLRGFSEGEWQATLDLAGYPRESRLPANHPPAAVTPLVARPAPAQPPLPAEPVVAPPPQPTIPLGSGGGIRF